MDTPYNHKEQDVYDQLQLTDLEQQNKSARQKEEQEKEKVRREEEQYRVGSFRALIGVLKRDAKRLKGEIIIAVLFLITAVNLVMMLTLNIISFVKINARSGILYNPFVIAVECVLPFLIWMKSSEYGAYNYHKIKHRLFAFCVANWIILTFGLFRIAATKILRSLFFAIPVSGTLPVRAVVIGYYVAAAGVIMLPMIALWLRSWTGINEKLMYRSITKFRISRILPDLPWKRKYDYDLCIVRNLETGKMHRIYEDDRRLHTKGVGSTGGGKTATILTVSFEADLRQKVKNIDTQKREVEKLLKAGKVYLTRNFEDIDFNIDYIKPVGTLDDADYKKVEERLKWLKYTVKSAGMTVMCPNEAFCDELYEKAKAKNLKINRVDPCVDADGNQKEDFVGFSPIYVPIIKDEPEDSYLFRVFTAAKLYADVNQAIFELSGKGDPYFTGLNKNISVTAAVAAIIAYPLLHPGEYATIEHVQAIVNDFRQIGPYREALVKKYGKKNSKGAINGKDVGENLQFVIDRIDRDFLGDNSTKINEQATGLRNIIDESLMNPRIRKILCAKHTLDIDRALEMGELTLVNFEISLGSDSTGFGMFFMLSFIQSVLRRPGTLKTRLPHFFALDEAPMLFHPRLELSTTLFRQYNVSMMLFMQSLTQYEKNDTTRYLKNVLTGNCAHQIIFGRASREDMEFYEKLSGYKWDLEETESVRETALSDEKTSQAYSHSFDLEQNERISTDDVRYREFLECTVFSTKNSTPLEPFLGKTNFLPRGYDPHMDRYYVDWSKYYQWSAAKEESETEEKLGSAAYTATSKTAVSEITTLKKEEENTIEVLDMGAPLFGAGSDLTAESMQLFGQQLYDVDESERQQTSDAIVDEIPDNPEEDVSFDDEVNNYSDDDLPPFTDEPSYIPEDESVIEKEEDNMDEDDGVQFDE